VGISINYSIGFQCGDEAVKLKLFYHGWSIVTTRIRLQYITQNKFRVFLKT